MYNTCIQMYNKCLKLVFDYSNRDVAYDRFKLLLSKEKQGTWFLCSNCRRSFAGKVIGVVKLEKASLPNDIRLTAYRTGNALLPTGAKCVYKNGKGYFGYGYAETGSDLSFWVKPERLK